MRSARFDYPGEYFGSVIVEVGFFYMMVGPAHLGVKVQVWKYL